MADKITKKKLMDEIEEKIQALNLLKSALQEDRSRKTETLKDYQDKFDDILNSRSK
jgi:hypothetical protein